MIHNAVSLGISNSGAVDVSTSMQLALDGMQIGDSLYMPSGNYLLAQPLTINQPLTIQGGNEKATSFIVMHPDGDTLTVGAPGIRIQGVRFQPHANTVRQSGAYINILPAAVQCSVRDFEMHGAYDGIRIAAGASVRIQGGHILNTHNVGIDVWDGCDHIISCVTMDNPPTAQPLAGIRINQTGNINITDCDIIHSGFDLYIRGGASVYALNSYFDTAEYGLVIDASLGAVVRSHFIGCWFCSHSGGGVSVNGQALIDDIIFDACNVNFNSLNGIYLANAENVKVLGSTLAGNTLSGLVLGNVKNGIVSANRIGASEAVQPNMVGVWLDGPEKCIVVGNNLTGNTWAGGFAGVLPEGNLEGLNIV